MADDKKPDSKSAKPAEAPHEDPFVEIIWFVLSLFVFVYIANGIVGAINSGSLSLFGLNILSPQKTISLSQAPSLLGGKVVTTRSTTVFAEPGVNQIATKQVGSRATLIDGPIIKDGTKYWHVQFDDGTNGWVSEGNLNYLSSIGVPLSSMPSMIGAKILVSRNESALYGSPGGEQIGVVKNGTAGKIIEGPIINNGVKYWHVRFDDGREGWVAEDNLEYVAQQSLVSGAKDLLAGLFVAIKIIAVGLSALLIGFIFYLYRKLVELRESEKKALFAERTESAPLTNPQWDKVLSHVESPNESDWRLAILEADMMLDTLLDNMRLPGETMADKLKAVDQNDFNTIDNAWEAHKIRNQIAHEGDFVLSQVEAKRVIALFKTVFEEFRII